MIEIETLPSGLIEAIGSESKDFAVKASRAQPVKSSIAMLLFSLFWLAFTSIFVVAFLGPIFVGKEVQFSSGGVDMVAGPGNLEPIVVPALIIGLFVLVGIGMFIFSLYSILKKGGYFVGTSTRLIHYQKNGFRSVDWEQFSGDIQIRGNDKKGDITLGLRSGRMVSRKNGPDRYVPDTFYLSGIPNVFEIERICRKRIKENDPTPPLT